MVEEKMEEKKKVNDKSSGFSSFDGADFDVTAAHHAVPAASAGALLGNAADSVVVGGALRRTPRIHVNTHTHAHQDLVQGACVRARGTLRKTASSFPVSHSNSQMS